MKQKVYNGNIYKFENKLNGKIYIGQSRCIERRYEAHVYCDKPMYELDRAIKKYGIENFNYEILESFDTENLEEVNKWMDEREDYYIQFYNSLHPNGYNLLSNRHHPEFSELTRKRISEACMGEKNGFYGRKHSEETKKKMSESAKKRGNNHPDFVRTQEMINKWKVSMKHHFETMTDEEREKLCKIQSERYKRWRNNLTDEEYDEWNHQRIEKGLKTRQERFKNGTLKGSTTGKIAINNGIVGKKILPEELDKYLEEGWVRGALWNKSSKAYNGNSILYYYDNKFVKEYSTIKEAANDLNLSYKTIYKLVKGLMKIHDYDSYKFVYKKLN